MNAARLIRGADDGCEEKENQETGQGCRENRPGSSIDQHFRSVRGAVAGGAKQRRVPGAHAPDRPWLASSLPRADWTHSRSSSSPCRPRIDHTCASGAASQNLPARVIGAGACSEGERAKWVGREYPFSTGLDEGKWTFCGQSAIHAIFDCKSCKP